MPRGKSPRLGAEALWDYALRTLSARAHSVAELREKLRPRAERAEDVAAVVARLKEYGYLNDRRFAETFAVARRDHQGFGRLRVLRDLRQRRVAPEVAERAVREAYRDADESELIEKFLTRKYRKVVLAEWLADPKNLAATYRRLRGAGFTAACILAVLRRYLRQSHHVETLESLAAEPDELASEA
ncbi:MAG: regulatory protein RecX [Bryobacterales bacterium]|nr:recombination regulator RecX [Bryobacteraceae bacterium]MDW8353676.1 regulatory protein RecX [Bryobacterales bacterium]